MGQRAWGIGRKIEFGMGLGFGAGIFFGEYCAFLQIIGSAISGLESAEKPIVVDLGGGSGRFLEKLLSLNPNAMTIWVDSSEKFLSVAKKRLAAFGDRVTFISSPLEERWDEKIEHPVDGVFSMSAIHHLESIKKRATIFMNPLLNK